MEPIDWTIAPTEKQFFLEVKQKITDRKCRAGIGLAWVLSVSAHEGQLREGGDPYVTHCQAVAWYILTQTGIKDQLRLTILLIVALLHDTQEDTIFDQKSFWEFAFGHFNAEIAECIHALTKYKKGDRFRRLLASNHPAVFFIKGVDRLHNLITIFSFKSTAKIAYKVQETKDVILPWLKDTSRLDNRYQTLDLLKELKLIVQMIEAQLAYIEKRLTELPS